jgi:heat shock protein HslJ
MKKITLSVVAIICVTVLILSACASLDAQASQTNLAGTSWVLISYGNVADQSPALPGVPTSVIFASDGQVSGNLGCNGFSGNFKVKDGKLEFNALASTLMACPDPQMVQEGSAFKVLSGTVSFSLEGDLLTIFDSTGKFALQLSRVLN